MSWFSTRAAPFTQWYYQYGIANRVVLELLSQMIGRYPWILARFRRPVTILLLGVSSKA